MSPVVIVLDACGFCLVDDLTAKEKNCLIMDNYLPLILKPEFGGNYVVLMDEYFKLELFYNHKFDGSGATNFVVSDRFDLEYCRNVRSIANMDIENMSYNGTYLKLMSKILSKAIIRASTNKRNKK